MADGKRRLRALAVRVLAELRFWTIYFVAFVAMNVVAALSFVAAQESAPISGRIAVSFAAFGLSWMGLSLYLLHEVAALKAMLAGLIRTRALEPFRRPR